MIPMVLGAFTLIGAAIATFASDLRRAILALWFTGLCVGGLCLSVGAEYLAIVQWVVSTLIGISFVFFAVMFGEYSEKTHIPWRKKTVAAVLPVIFGVIAWAIICVGARSVFPQVGWIQAAGKGADLAALGRALSEEHWVSLEVLALTLLIVLVGGGVIARAKEIDQ